MDAVPLLQMRAALRVNAASDLRARTLSGLSWTGMSQTSQQAVQFITTAVLAHLLTPADFGLIALLFVFTGFVGVFADFGVTAALIQRADLREQHLRTAFWFNAAAGVVLAALTVALAPAIAAFYGKPQLVGLTAALAATFVFNSIGIVQVASLQRAMKFRTIALIENTALAAASAAAIASAIGGLGVWSLAILTLVGSAARAGLLWLASDWRPKRGIDKTALRELWSFSGPLIAFNATNYWSRNADNLLIGKFLGVESLGFYTRAYSVMLLPVNVVSSVTSRVMFPALSRLQDDPAHFKRVYVRAVGLIALVTFPAIVGLFVVSRPFILTVYGEKWNSVIPILQILCVTALVQSVGHTVGWIYQAVGRTDWMFRWGLASTVLIVASFFVGLPWGIRGVASAYTVCTLLLLYPSFAIPGRLIGLRTAEIVAALKGVTAASVLMGACVWAVEQAIPQMWGPAVQLGLGTLTGVSAYFAILRVLSPAPYAELKKLISDAKRGRIELRPVG